MLLPRENTLRSLRTLYRDVLSSMYDVEEIDALWKYSLQDKLNMKVEQTKLDLPMLSESNLNTIVPVLERLVAGEPYQYVIGEVEFYGCKLKIDNRALIPRPETEELCELVVNENDTSKPLHVIDLGTGSGCIPIALKSNVPAWHVDALDVAEEALALAKENAVRNNVEIDFQQLDLLAAKELSRMYSIIVSNPPYIPQKQAVDILDNVLVHEPHVALFIDDNDFLVFYRKILEIGRHSLETGGKIYFEFNEFYGKEIKELMEKQGYSDIRVLQDLSGKDRFAICTKK